MALSTVPAGTPLGSTTFPHRMYHSGLTEVQFVHPSGSDSADGLTWGTAKATVLAAYDDLPAAGGVIYFADNSTVGGEVADQGLWFAGPGDPNYGSLPSGWRQIKPLRLIGEGAYYDEAHGPVAPRILGGSTTDTAKPALWTTGGMVGLTIENADFGTRAQPFMLGKSSTGSADTNNPVAIFRNVHGRVDAIAGHGPVWDLWSAYWCWWEHCTTAANEAELYTSDKRAAFLVRGSSIGAGLFYISDHQFAGGGGIKYYSGAGLNMMVERCVAEGVTYGGAVNAPIIWVPDVCPNGFGNLVIRQVENADQIGDEPCVRIAPGNDPAQVIVQNTGSVSGPATILQMLPASSSPPATQGQVGFHGDRIFGKHLASRMAFSPTLVRFDNKALQDTSTWSGQAGTATVTTGQVGPDLSTNAAKLTAAGYLERHVARFGQTIAAGDFIFGGVWARYEDVETNHLVQAVSLGSSHEDNLLDVSGTNGTAAELRFLGKGYEWVTVGGKFTSVGTASTELILALRADADHDMIYCYPIMYYIPTGTVSDDEAWEIFENLATHPDTATAGTVTTMRGQKLIARGGIGVGNSAAATTPGSVVKKMEVFSETGASLGFVPIYSSIT